VDGAGRWSLLHRPLQPHQADASGRLERERIEVIAQTLLRRYGVVFRRLLERETGLPPWRDLLYLYRRLEARGEIRGGRFVQGFSGEQFALPDALATLRQVRRDHSEAELVAVSGADPLNLTGILTPGKRVPANAGNRVLYRNGVPVALYIGRQVEFLGEIDPAAEWELRQHLLRQQQPGAFQAPPSLRPI
jgi:ATP-dependent Lhr-like helicase